MCNPISPSFCHLILLILILSQKSDLDCFVVFDYGISDVNQTREGRKVSLKPSFSAVTSRGLRNVIKISHYYIYVSKLCLTGHCRKRMKCGGKGERRPATWKFLLLCKKKVLRMSNTVYTQELILSVTFRVLAI